MPTVGIGSGSILQQGTHASRPAPSVGLTGYYYLSTDLNGGTLFQCTGSAWTQLAAPVNVTASATGAVANAGGAPSLQVGLDAAKPAAATAGRLYVATDTAILYEDSGSAWNVVATAAWSSITGKPSSFPPSAHESTHLLAGSDAIAGLDQTQSAVDSTEAATNDALTGGTLRTNLNRIRYQLSQLGTGAWNTLRAMVQLSPSSQQTGTINVSGEIQGSDFKPGGLSGATAATRYVGGTATSAPTTGTFAVGDYVITQSGSLWICTVAGTPGTWTQVSGGGGGSVSPATTSSAGTVLLDRTPNSISGSLWHGTTPATINAAGLGANANYGNEFYVDAPTTAASVSFYKGSSDTGTHTGALYNKATGALLASVTFSGETASGWQTQAFASPVNLAAATHYMIVLHTQSTYFCYGPTSSMAPNTGLHLVGNTVYDNNTSLDMPSANTSTGNTWAVDVNVSSSGTAFAVQTELAPTLKTANYTLTANDSMIVAGANNLTFTLPAANSVAAGFTYLIKNDNYTGTTIAAAGSDTIDSAATYALSAARASIALISDGTSLWRLSGGGGSSTLAGDTDVAISSPVGGQVLAYNQGTSKWQNQNQAGVAATTQTAQLGANVAMATANTYFDGPSVTLAPGTWLLTTGITVNCPTSGTNISVKLWDGTTAYASDEVTVPTGGADAALALSAVVSPSATTTYKISARSTNSLCNIQAAIQDGAAGNNATYINAIQLSGNPVGQQAPAVRCHNSGVVSVPNNTWTALTFDTNDLDQGTSTPQHSTSANTSRLVCRQAGTYLITGGGRWDNNSTGARGVRLVVNGTTTLDEFLVDAATISTAAGNASALSYLNLGDYVELWAFQSSGGTLTLGTGDGDNPHLSMARVDSGPGSVQPNTKVQLDYAATTDILNTTLTSATWTDVCTNQTFTVDDANSVIEIAVSGNVQINPGTANSDTGTRLVVDSGGTPITKFLGGCATALNDKSNALAGADTVCLTGLSAGSHTVKVQVYASASGVVAFCRAATVPNTEGLQIRVLERKQSVSPLSSTPAPAASVTNSTTTSIPSATPTVISMDTTTLDQGTSTPQHSTVTNTSRLTCRQAGVYQINGHGRWNQAPGGTNEANISVQVNGTTSLATSGAFGGDTREMSVSALAYLNVGDYVELSAYTAGTGMQIISSFGSPRLSMARVDTGHLPVRQWATVTTNYTVQTTDSCILVDTSAGAVTVTLPTAVGATQKYSIKKKTSDGNTVTIATTASQTIDGSSTLTLTAPGSALDVESDGANWFCSGGPRGLIGYAESTVTETTTSATAVDLSTPVSVTVTIGTRPVMLSAYCRGASNTTTEGNRATLTVYDVTAATGVVSGQVSGVSPSGEFILLAREKYAPAAGSRTFKLQKSSPDGGTAQFRTKIYLMVEEM